MRKNLFYFILFFAIAPLLVAYIFQYGFDYYPCKLCIYQRVPYFAVILCALIAFFVDAKWHKYIIYACIGLLAVEFLLAMYHIGVEEQVFEPSEGCVGQVANTMEELKKQIFETKPARCDQASWIFLGFSMAAWNAIYSFWFNLVLFVLLLKGKKMGF